MLVRANNIYHKKIQKYLYYANGEGGLASDNANYVVSDSAVAFVMSAKGYKMFTLLW